MADQIPESTLDRPKLASSAQGKPRSVPESNATKETSYAAIISTNNTRNPLRSSDTSPRGRKQERHAMLDSVHTAM